MSATDTDWQGIPLTQAFELWRTAAPRKHSTVRSYGEALKRLAGYGLRTLGDVTRERTLEVQRARLERAKPSTVNSEFIAVRSMCAFMQRAGFFPATMLAEIRAVKLRLPKTGRSRRVRFLSQDEVDRLLDGAVRVVPRLELPILVALLTGARVGELARLRAEDHRAGALFIRNLPEFGEAGSCKTGERVVPVAAPLSALFRERFPSSGWLFPSGTTYSGRGPTPKIPFLSRCLLEDGLKRARRAAALPEDICFTVLRHTCASTWLQGGVSIYKVADWLGHSVEVCEKHYGSLKDGYDADCEVASPMSLARSGPTPPPLSHAPMYSDEVRGLVEAAGGRPNLAKLGGVSENGLRNWLHGRTSVPPVIAARLRAITPEQLAAARRQPGRSVSP